MNKESKQNKTKKVFLDDLPKWKKGDGAVKEGYINWKKSIGYKIKGIYNEINFEIEIIDYDGKYLYIKYLDKELFKIGTGGFQKCRLGKLLGTHTSGFKVEIGQVFKDDKRDIIITNREHRIKIKNNGSKLNDKWYKYTCNKCGNEGWILENPLLKGCNCNVCSKTPRKALLGVNTIWDTDRWMCDLGLSEEDAKIHTRCSCDKISVKCPDCRRERQIAVYQIYSSKSISCVCSDGFSYPEKLMFSILEQLDVKFKTEFKPKWCNFKDYNDINKIKTGRYDFLLNDIFINNRQVIIEMDGGFHYTNNRLNEKTKEESKYIDDMKDKLALENGYKVIRIDCNYKYGNKMEYIKQNILNSILNELFDFNKIKWDMVNVNSNTNISKQSLFLWNKEHKNVKEISEILKISKGTIRTYLKNWSKIGLCNYNPLEQRKGIINNKTSKSVICLDNGIVFASAHECERQSIDVFGVSMNYSSIASNCRGETKYYKGFHFKYIQDLSEEEMIEYKINEGKVTKGVDATIIEIPIEVKLINCRASNGRGIIK